jgi:hypothetical protein
MRKNQEASRCLAKALELNGENSRAIKWKSIVEKGGKPEPAKASGSSSGVDEAPEAPENPLKP